MFQYYSITDMKDDVVWFLIVFILICYLYMKLNSTFLNYGSPTNN